MIRHSCSSSRKLAHDIEVIVFRHQTFTNKSSSWDIVCSACTLEKEALVSLDIDHHQGKGNFTVFVSISDISERWLNKQFCKQRNLIACTTVLETNYFLRDTFISLEISFHNARQKNSHR